MIVVSICSESTVIIASLSQIQSLLLKNQDLADLWKSQAELPVVLDVALTGCMVIFSCIDAELQRIVPQGSDPGQIRWRSKVRMMWNEQRLIELLNALRGQQTAINLLIQLLQMNTLTDIKQMLQQKQDVIETSIDATQSLRSANPTIMVANSIYNSESRADSIMITDTASVIAPSELEFEFDNMIINSQAYRRAFAKAHKAQAEVRVVNPAELGDLIDFTDEDSIIHEALPRESLSVACRDLKGLSLHEVLSEKVFVEYAERQATQLNEDVDTRKDNSMIAQRPPVAVNDRDGQHRPRSGEAVLDHSISLGGKSRCLECNEEIHGTSLRVQGNAYHTACFKCSDCSMALTEFYSHEGTTLCETDFFRRLDLVCASCDKALKVAYVICNGRKYHEEHFKCEQDGCDYVFTIKDTCYMHEGSIYCVLHHYSSDYVRKCRGCELPTLGEYVELEFGQHVGMKDEAWHPLCYSMYNDWDVTARLLLDIPLKLKARGWVDNTGSLVDRRTFDLMSAKVMEKMTRISSVLRPFEERVKVVLGEVLLAVLCKDFRNFIERCKMAIYSFSIVIQAIEHVELLPSLTGRNSGYKLHDFWDCLMRYARQEFRKVVPNPDHPVKENKGQEYLDDLGKEVTRLMLSSLQLLPTPSLAMGSLQLESFLEALSEGEKAMSTAKTIEDQLGKLTLGSLLILTVCKTCGKAVNSKCYASLLSEEMKFWHLTCVPCFHCGVNGSRTRNRGGYDKPDQPGLRETEISCILCGSSQVDITFVCVPYSKLLICRFYVELFYTAKLSQNNEVF